MKNRFSLSKTKNNKTYYDHIDVFCPATGPNDFMDTSNKSYFLVDLFISLIYNSRDLKLGDVKRNETTYGFTNISVVSSATAKILILRIELNKWWTSGEVLHALIGTP